MAADQIRQHAGSEAIRTEMVVSRLNVAHCDGVHLMVRQPQNMLHEQDQFYVSSSLPFEWGAAMRELDLSCIVNGFADK